MGWDRVAAELDRDLAVAAAARAGQERAAQGALAQVRFGMVEQVAGLEVALGAAAVLAVVVGAAAAQAPAEAPAARGH